ncbi:MAG: Fpg/Nei family DNA glycosylase [Microthrixaceae bacterium]
MPELLEVEAYRRAAAGVVDREVAEVHAPDAWFLKRGLTAAALEDVLAGARITAARRWGKLLLLPLDRGPVVGLRFGMTGRLVVDGTAPIEHLEYGPAGDRPGWVRFGLGFADGGVLELVDPRRLGGVELDPPLDRLGPEASTVTVTELRDALRSDTSLKAALLDQSRLAGLGNLLVDETLWRARLDPTRPAGGLSPEEQRRLARAVRSTVRELGRRGGSHTGDLQDRRRPDGDCPCCGAPLRRDVVGGRTTYHCPACQR